MTARFDHAFGRALDCTLDRRHALGLIGLASLAACSVALAADDAVKPAQAAPATAKNPISLAQWSLHRRFGFGRPAERDPNPRDPMDFPKIAREEFGISRVEYVNQFYAGKAGKPELARELRTRCDDLGVKSLLIMCDGLGTCGAASDEDRAKFAANHDVWLELAAALGCHSIRVNAIGEGSKDEQAQRCADGLAKLVARAKPHALSVIVENHGGLSSDGAWLAGVIRAVGDSTCGTLPDFGNWRDEKGVLVDPVKNVSLVMPYAKAVSAKSYDFDAEGNDTLLDYPKLMAEVRRAGYTGSIGIEYEGKKMSEHDGILATKRLLERLGCEA
jgi:sugar phosphate isomerase/epimerase